MYYPSTTYRIQFHKNFGFQELENIITYLHQLGVSTIYASPVFSAVPGSIHGYDALDSNAINTEIGTEEKLRQLSKKANSKGIGWIQDIVPNHMAFDTRNPWITDLLEKGAQSQYAGHFDVALNHRTQSKWMVPFLSSSLEEAIANREIKLVYENGRLSLKYYEAAYPLHPHSYQSLLSGKGSKPLAIEQLLQQMHDIKQTEDVKAYALQWHEWLQQLEGLMKNRIMRHWIDEQIEAVNSNKEKLQQVAEEQVYRLCHWQQTDGSINYRRFFIVNGLICLNIQNTEVLQEHHQLIKTLVHEGVFQGLRIDHIDGLYDPTAYLEALREMMGKDTYVVVEKILEWSEDLPPHWPIQGTSGYEFLALVNNLLTKKRGEQAFTQFYSRWAENEDTFSKQVRDKKAFILYQHMGGELENLFQLFMSSGLVAPEEYSQLRTEDIKTAIAEVLIHCPVYRFYGNHMPLKNSETQALQNIFQQVKMHRADLTKAVDLLETALVHRTGEGDEDYRRKALHFYQRCMQFTGPLMAKGVEDTLMYTYNRFIGHNEVGDTSETFGLSIEDFHQAMLARQKQWPLSLNATATHDTKRGEDARARLAALTDLNEEWFETAEKWMEWNKSLKRENAPDKNDEYFIYQTLLATYPMPGDSTDDYAERLQAYLEKAVREGKRHSNWTKPNEEYESATKQFALALLDTSKPFWKSFEALLQKVADYGIINSLVQTILKFTCPGVPDVYQGCELWDFSFVDPDNRRPVDYAFRKRIIQELEEKKDSRNYIQQLWEERTHGRIKLWLVQQLALLRRQKGELFTRGDYKQITVKGKYASHVLAFARKAKQHWFVVVVPLNLATLCEEQGVGMLQLDWADTCIDLPDGTLPQWEHLLTRTTGEMDKKAGVQHLFNHLPFALLKGSEPVNERSAGILLHISSLPSRFGIGDFGLEAYHFADFLYRSGQRWWQILPLNPTEAGQGYSPYSSNSSMAGNYLFISPELLVQEGLLLDSEVEKAFIPPQGTAKYAEAERVKKELLQMAWKRFSAKEKGADESAFFPDHFLSLQREFNLFCEKEKAWLQDFACYAALKEVHDGKPWYEWPPSHKKYNREVLIAFEDEHIETITYLKWQQFIFHQQWQALKAYCKEKGIGFIGDIPFYVSYDSADVWAHRRLFKIDEDGKALGIAGVPPDAFSDDGQLWGMPVFDWEALKAENYSWWIGRLKKNRELFDLVRLDHFRAFAGYWEVPAGETTARNGEWKQGPGAHFFETVKQYFGELPFIAEDLGDITPDVLQLRDQFGLQGMKVLQFAFDEHMPKSQFIPHNYDKAFVAYTGTHDNNTTLGWYTDESNNEIKLRIEKYAGRHVPPAEVPHFFSRLAYGSVARMVILPLQDVLCLGSEARMNKPGPGENNWTWQLLPGQVTGKAEEVLNSWTEVFNR